ncbi:MAG: glycosyltransferase family 2 protein [Ignavibacteriales bacterium]|nr:glycosyltransferase family 2 protein [Ignavibacteriales bacterium]MBK7378001.1 glycosyltransferase family 2 protein [Ignavibacteriales bacterium]
MLLSVCIATFQRPELLKKLLFSLVSQKIEKEILLEIIVVDNDKNETARNIVTEFNDTDKFKYSYLVQPEKNISLTRNLAVAKANGEYILFIDDDEYASENWVMELFRTVTNFGADGVFGTVNSYFSEGTPDWIRQSFIYNRPTFKTGTVATITRSGNCLIKRATIKSVDGPFDPAYGISGGSDTKLFYLLISNGAKFVNSFEAETFEFVPPERATLKWLVKRAFRTGNGFVRRLIENKKENTFIVKFKFITIGLSFSLISICLAILLFPLKSKRIHWYLKFIANLGKLSAVFGYYPLEYS